MDKQHIDAQNRLYTEKYLAIMREMSRTDISDTLSAARSTDGFYYMRVTEISKRWESEETPACDLLTNLFIGMYSVNAPISVVLSSKNNEISLYIGCQSANFEILEGMLSGIFPMIKYQKNETDNTAIFDYSQIVDGSLNCSGVLKGNPTGTARYDAFAQIDNVIKGMGKKPWSVSVFATPIAREDVLCALQNWLAESSECSELSEINFNETNNLETLSYKKEFYHCEQYIKMLEDFSRKCTQGLSLGEWCVSYNFSSSSSENAHLLGGLLSSAFFGDDSVPEPIHAMYYSYPTNQPIVYGMNYTQNIYSNKINYPSYSTLLTGKELAILSSFPTVDTFGLSVSDFVQFDVDRDTQGDLSIGSILDCGTVTNNIYQIDSNELNRHCLVVGLTGSGKTNTVKSLLYNLTDGQGRPLLVIEPAKKEYWELYKLGYSDLHIYSVGSSEPNTHTLCINPFERVTFTDKNGRKKAVPIQTHIDFVYAAFKASFIMYTPMPYVLERAIYSIYEDCGWDIHNNTNINGDDVYPTIEDLYDKIPEIVIQMGYDQRMRSDLIGSLQARINSLRIGSKGDTLNVYNSFPMDKLFENNVVIELEDIGDDDVKAFIISLLLVNLLEYRRQQEDSQLELKHIVLIEEAHRLLKNVSSGTGENADPRGAAVEFFCNLLAELRSKGQGFIVADQIPSKLAPDLIKNTNLKIVHRTVSEEERLLVGGAMHMTPEQMDYLSCLSQGVAAVYSEGDNRPKLVKPKYAGVYTVDALKGLSREDVLVSVTGNCIRADGDLRYENLTDKRSSFCKRCDRICRRNPRDILRSIDDIQNFYDLADRISPKTTKPAKVRNMVEQISEFVDTHMVRPSVDREHDICCIMNCLLDRWEIKDTTREEITGIFVKRKEHLI